MSDTQTDRITDVKALQDKIAPEIKKKGHNKRISVDASGFRKLLRVYKQALGQLEGLALKKFSIDQALNHKRNPLNKGPYPHVSYFETANRVCSDLVLLMGTEKLMKKHTKVTLWELALGTAKGVDLIGKDKQGKELVYAEAFCATGDYYTSKLRNEAKAFLNNKTKFKNRKASKYLLVQTDNNLPIEKKNSPKNKPGFEIIRVDIRSFSLK